jgi:MFS family permease
MRLKDFLPSSQRDGEGRAPVLLRYRSSRWFILTTVSVAIFTVGKDFAPRTISHSQSLQDVFLYGIIVPVVPFALIERVNISNADVQHWVSILLAVYSVGLLVGSPILGWAVDKSKTRRLPLLIGLVVLGGATIMLCIGTSIAILVVGRLLQGFSAAVVWTTGLALLVDTVGNDDVGQTMGIISMAYSIGILVGPLLGGVVYASSGYYAVFYMAFGLIALDIVLRFSFIEKKVAARWLVVDNTTTLGGMTIAETGPTSHELQLRDGAEEIEAQLQHNVEPVRPPRPKMRLPPVVTLLGSRRLLAAFWGCLVVAALTTAFDSTLPLYVKRIFGWNSLGSGLLFLALLLPSIIGPVIGMTSFIFVLTNDADITLQVVCPTNMVRGGLPRLDL